MTQRFTWCRTFLEAMKIQRLYRVFCARFDEELNNREKSEGSQTMRSVENTGEPQAQPVSLTSLRLAFNPYVFGIKIDR